jgi:hypothetical protein
MFSLTFKDNSRDINYTSATSKDVTYNITNNVSVSAGALIGDNVSMERLANTLVPYIEKALKKRT